MRIKQNIIAFVHFSRPHTIIGTTLSVTVLFFLAIFLTDHSTQPYILLIKTLVACLGANIYIVGLNQLTDIEIDKINKPYLPLASGAFSIRTGYILILVGFLLSLVFATYSGHYLLLTVIISLVLGTVYSVPPFRLKRFYFWSAFCIIAIRGLIVNIFLYLHFQYQMTGLKTTPQAIFLLTAAMFGYSLVIAWFKDIPDMKGDSFYQIQTMSIKLGARRVFFLGNILITAILLTLTLISFFGSNGLNAPVMATTHLLMLIMLWVKSTKVNPERQEDIKVYYLFIWTLFFFEYISFGIAAGIADS